MPAPADGWTSLPLPAIYLEGGRIFRFINPEAEAFLNLSQQAVSGRRLDDPALALKLGFTPELRDIIDNKLQGGSRHSTSVELRVADLSGAYMRHKAVLHLAVANDAGDVSLVLVPEPEGRLGRSAGMISPAATGMGQMLAHEIKNPLAAIQGAAQLIAMDLDPGQEAQLQMVDLIAQECAQIVGILSQVERFGDPAAPCIQAFNLHDVTEHARRSAQTGLASGTAAARTAGIAVVTDYDPSLPEAEGDAGQILQVVVNLLANAVEAITSSGKGSTIKIRTFYDASVRLGGRALPLQIRIEDDGPGLPPALAERIFEPFVSGRENGTGLGLALAAKIMADHNAMIRHEALPGYTGFRISLAIATAGGKA